jgi:methyltransferase (TIGR00027 family)
VLDRVRVFEVDHPASQRWKRQRLHELGIDPPPNLVYAPVDFEQQALRDGLTAAGFDFTSQAVWSWLGVTMYLTLDAIRATLATIAECSPGTRVVLTYNLPRSELDGLSLSLGRTMHSIVSGLGEPMISLFTPAEIEQLVRALGYDEISHYGPEESRTMYFADRDDGHFGGPQRILIATVAGLGAIRLIARPPAGPNHLR